MVAFQTITVNDAMHNLSSQQAILVDIRDSASFKQFHVNGAYHLTNDNVATFLEHHDKHQPIMVVCYRGNSSKQVADFLVNQGYLYVYSVDGGMTLWGDLFPHSLVSDSEM